MLPKEIHLLLQLFGLPCIITVYARYQFSRRVGYPIIETIDHMLVSVREERLNSWIDEGLDDLLGFVGGAVVKNNKLPILIRLRKNTFNGLLDQKLTVVIGHDNAH